MLSLSHCQLILFNAVKDMSLKYLTCGSPRLKAQHNFSRPTVPGHCKWSEMGKTLFSDSSNFSTLHG